MEAQKAVTNIDALKKAKCVLVNDEGSGGRPYIANRASISLGEREQNLTISGGVRRGMPATCVDPREIL